MNFLEGLGRWRMPAWTPADAVTPRAYRVMLLRNYIVAMELRAIRGAVDWTACKARAVALLRAEERAA